MIQKLELPKFLAIFGQTGAGKTLTATILSSWLTKKAIPYVIITFEEITKVHIKNELAFKQKLESLGYKKGTIVIFEGSLISFEQFCFLESFVFQTFREKLFALQVKAIDEICMPRVVERTKNDKRPDLSIDGQEGVPDENKIQNKMIMRLRSCEKIEMYCKKNDSYLCVTNNETDMQLKNQLSELFLNIT